MELRLAGIDLLHAGAETLARRLGPAETQQTPEGRAFRWRDARAGFLLEIVLDAESGGVRFARVVRLPSPRPLSPPSASAFRLPRPLTGKGLSISDPAAAVARALGRPHRVERGGDGRVDYLYRAPMRPDGSLPAYRARYTLAGGRLEGLAIALGE